MGVTLSMGQRISKSTNTTITNTTNRDDQHYCSIQVGGESSFGLEIDEIQRQFGHTYVYFKVPVDKIDQIRHKYVDIRYQRTSDRNYNANINDNIINQLDKLQDSLKTSLRGIRSHKNIINSVQYEEYRFTSERNNNFIFRFSTEGKPTLTIRYMFQHS